MRRITYRCPGTPPVLSWRVNPFLPSTYQPPKGPSLCGFNPDGYFPAKECGAEISIIEEWDFCDINGEEWSCQKLKCGHEFLVPKQKKINKDDRNILWDNLLPFQKEFVYFAEKNNLRAILRDEMGLGKTIQSLSLLRENAAEFTSNFEKYCVIVSPVGSIFNWEEEALKWLGCNNPSSFEQMMLRPQVIVTSGQILSTLSKVVIIPWSKLGDKKIKTQLLELGIASIIVDEAHFFKDPGSARTSNLLELVKEAGDKSPLVLMSGTLSENKVMEMFIPLNLMDPRFFHSPYVLDNFCLHNGNGKALTVAPWLREKFFNRTHNYMMGRKKTEVNIPLPDFLIHHEWTDPSQFSINEEYALAYNKTLDELSLLLELPKLSATCIIGLMQQLRHYTGKMKMLGAATFIETWMMTHPNEKLTVGVHHIAVREALAELLSHHKPLQMSDEDPRKKDEIERAFRDGKSNLLICSIIAAGVGRNFQFCKNAVILERQWNRSKEDQFFQRFHRIQVDSEGRVRDYFTEEDTVHLYYFQAQDSFDQYFDPLVHLKGIIVDSVDESVEELPDENTILDLARAVVTNRIKWVGL